MNFKRGSGQNMKSLVTESLHGCHVVGIWSLTKLRTGRESARLLRVRHQHLGRYDVEGWEERGFTEKDAEHSRGRLMK
jgi:hypothetical protein